MPHRMRPLTRCRDGWSTLRLHSSQRAILASVYPTLLDRADQEAQPIIEGQEPAPNVQKLAKAKTVLAPVAPASATAARSAPTPRIGLGLLVAAITAVLL